MSASNAQVFGEDGAEVRLVGWNVSTRYVAIAVDALIRFMMLPFNIAHLGKSAYGLWALTASITIYFSVLDMGYGGALITFVALTSFSFYVLVRDREPRVDLALVYRIGLTGVALGTLITVRFPAAFVLFPAASGAWECRLLRRSRRESGPPSGQWLVCARRSGLASSSNRSGSRRTCWMSSMAGLVYQALFLLGRPAQERQLYWTKLKEVLRQRRAVAVAA